MELMTIKNNFGLIKIVPKALGEKMIREQLATAYSAKEDRQEKVAERKEQVIEITNETELGLEYLSSNELKAKCDELGITYKPSIKKDELISLLK